MSNLRLSSCPAEYTWFLILMDELTGENVAFVSNWLTKTGLHKLCGVFQAMYRKCKLTSVYQQSTKIIETLVLGEGHLIVKFSTRMGDLNGFLVLQGGNLNKLILKSSNTGGKGGGC